MEAGRCRRCWVERFGAAAVVRRQRPRPRREHPGCESLKVIVIVLRGEFSLSFTRCVVACAWCPCGDPAAGSFCGGSASRAVGLCGRGTRLPESCMFSALCFSGGVMQRAAVAMGSVSLRQELVQM